MGGEGHEVFKNGRKRRGKAEKTLQFQGNLKAVTQSSANTFHPRLPQRPLVTFAMEGWR